MKNSKRSRNWPIFAAVLLSTSIAAWTASAVQAESRVPSPAGLMREAQRLSSEESLAEATVAARAAMEAGRKSSALDFTELDAGVLLVNLLHKQGRYDEARKAAEEQIAYWEQKAASAGSTGRRDSRSTNMLGLAIEASMMAGERAEVARLQEKLFAVASPDPGLWRLSLDEPRLHYELADFSMPLMLGQWKLTEFEPAKKRDFITRVLYTQVLADSHLSAEISLSYDETQRKQSAAQRQEWGKSYQGQHEAQALASAMPDLPFNGLTSVKLGRQEECDGEQCVNVHWIALNGDWRMDINVIFRSRDEAQATEQVRSLFAALKWQSAPPLFRERTIVEQIQDMDSYWNVPGGWSKAAELAEQALPDAFFSEEIARVQTYIGVSQYRRGALDAARRSLGLAVPAWEIGFTDESLYRTALDYAADIAYRQGRGHDAVALNRRLIEWQESDATLGWTIPKDENALVNRRKDMRLPLRVGDYRLRLDTESRFYYENLQTGAQLGLTVGMAQSSDEELEPLLRSFMAEKLGLQAGEMRRTKFSPKSAEHGEQQATGRRWEFDVTKLPDDKGASDNDPVTGVLRETPVKMAFWIVDRKDLRSLLRAPIMAGGQTRTEANQIAQALSW
ncbi:hypothetical protein [Pseudomonas fluorescens]|uniref:hypothetical protein n=1 Tax=Pseudomonas TaxID=286 RepID=UPI003D01A467